jgi:HSP20 family protein
MSLLTRFERWDPFEELTTLRNRMDRMVARMTNDDETLFHGRWSPTTDVVESDDTIVLKAELPGVAAKDIAVNVGNGILTLQGEREYEGEKEEKGYRRIERSYGKFVRSFAIPPNVEAEHIRASYANGLLEVTMPKNGEAKARKINVDVARSEPRAA